jgi:hypothetical protein
MVLGSCAETTRKDKNRIAKNDPLDDASFMGLPPNNLSTFSLLLASWNGEAK